MSLFKENDGMDEEGCLPVYDNSYDFYIMVLQTFAKEISKTADGMEETFAAGDVENYRILVHGLKGSGGSAGAVHLVEMATESNALIKEGKWDEAKAFHEDIIKELRRLIELIPMRISEFKG
jgi:HPt (histidine-containing phosphotransfer) domain-containing protein